MWRYFLPFLLIVSCNKRETLEVPGGYFPQPSQPIPEPREPPRPGFQTVDLVESDILNDLENLNSDTQRTESRYFIGCDRHNNGESMNEFTQGVNRGINQLSSERELFYSTPIGGGECVYRVDLTKLGWTKQDWELIANNDVLQFQSKTVRNRNIQFLTQSRRPYIFGASALLTAYEGDAVADKRGAIYYSILRQDANTTNFLRDRGVDRQAIVNDEEAMFSGFSSSQIALGKTRMIAVFDSTDGVCISTYDTVLGGDDIFKNPFTLELARAGQVNNQQVTLRIFQHDAQEHICTRPNGLFAEYRLNDRADTGQSIAPANVVTNLQGAAANIDSQIRLGDCMVCHYKESAILGFQDQLRAHITSNPAFSNVEKKLGAIFFRFDKITARVAELNRAHARAMTELGITASEDPLWNVVMKPLRKEMTIEQVAAYMLLDSVTFKERLRGAPISSQVFGNLLSGGSVNLATLSKNFKVLTEETAAYEDENL
jgi:hypothetical protein